MKRVLMLLVFGILLAGVVSALEIPDPNAGGGCFIDPSTGNCQTPEEEKASSGSGFDSAGKDSVDTGSLDRDSTPKRGTATGEGNIQEVNEFIAEIEEIMAIPLASDNERTCEDKYGSGGQVPCSTALNNAHDKKEELESSGGKDTSSEEDSGSTVGPGRKFFSATLGGWFTKTPGGLDKLVKSIEQMRAGQKPSWSPQGNANAHFVDNVEIRTTDDGKTEVVIINNEGGQEEGKAVGIRGGDDSAKVKLKDKTDLQLDGKQDNEKEEDPSYGSVDQSVAEDAEVVSEENNETGEEEFFLIMNDIKDNIAGIHNATIDKTITDPATGAQTTTKVPLQFEVQPGSDAELAAQYQNVADDVQIRWGRVFFALLVLIGIIVGIVYGLKKLISKIKSSPTTQPEMQQVQPQQPTETDTNVGQPTQ